MENNNVSGNPWKGLSSYSYKDADRFYGRDQELRDIAAVIKQNAFTTLYGISGAGKTSIINAGLFPLLEKQSFLPIYIRLDHNVGHISYDMQIIKAVDNALVAIEAESEQIVEHKVESELDKLWLYFHSHRFWSKDNHIVNPIIFIDQFEEIFTKNDDTENIWSFFNIIDSLQYNTPTERIIQTMESIDQFVSFGEENNFRIVFSMREDFLARLEDYSYNIPALRKNRIGLKPLNGLQALEVILKPRPDMVNRKVALHIISKVVGKNLTDNERKLEATSVDTSILSLFCTELYNYAIKDNKGEISIPLVDLYGGNILEWFYDRNMQILPKHTYVYLENQLLTHSGFRNSVALENLLENGVLQEQLDLLAENRIVRIEDVNHNLRVEFTHDVLCKIAKKRKDERDKIEEMKGEKSARRAFTIDCIILFSAFTFGLLAIYYGGFDKYLIASILSLPFITFLSMVIIHRTVADKNLSNTFWFLIICWALEIGLVVVLFSLESNLKEIITDKLFFSIEFSFLSIPPLAIILMPFAILSKLSVHDRLPFFNNMKRSVPFYLLFLSFQSILLGFWYFYFVCDNRGDSECYMPFLPYFLIPCIILVLSPVYFLYQNIKKKRYKLLSGYSCAYSFYILWAVVLIWIESEYHFFVSSNSNANIVSIGIIWGVIIVLCVFYAVLYMKQPKRQSYIDFCENVLSFQSFKKYKSFTYRLHTIIICFIVFMMGVIATHYIDILPFFTLPAAIILCLYAAIKEFKMTTAKTAFSLKTVLPILFLSEIIVGCQYFIGSHKIVSIYVAASLMTILFFCYLVYKETIRSRKLFALRLFVFSALVGFLLPMICLGYNVFNPSLSSVKRVWNGRISSDARNIYFMTIVDEIGNVGVMDYSEIIVEPKYQKIAPECSINRDIVGSVYQFRSILMGLFDIRYRGSGYRFSDDTNGEDILSFYIASNKSSNHSLKGLDFLKYENKYGLAYVDLWLSTYGSSEDKAFNEEKAFNILSSNNKCISERDRNAAIIRLYIKELAEFTGVPSYTFKNEGNEKIRIFDSDDEMEKIFKTCYNDVTLEPLLKMTSNLSLQNIYMASKNTGYLFVCDKTGTLANIVLDKLWNKLANDSIDNTVMEDKSYFFLLSGDKEKSENVARNSVKENLTSINAVCNLCLALYVNRKVSEMDTLLSHFKTSYSNLISSHTSFYEILLPKLSELEKFGLIKEKSDFLKNVSFIITEDMQRIIHERSDAALNNLAYVCARSSEFNFAITCIDKAIEKNPLEANYYDSKGEILLMQGKEKEAIEMWKKVTMLNPFFAETHDSELHRLLLERNLIIE